MPFLGVAGIGGLIAFLKQGALPTVFGGVLSEDSTYFYRTFSGSGTLTVASGILKADVLVIAGGGGAGVSNVSPPGGAGGITYFSGQSIATSAVVTVGAGGASSSNNGSASQLGSLTAAVGGGAGNAWSSPGTGFSGGSGGGGAGSSSGSYANAGGASTQTGVGATAYYGNAGGSGATGGGAGSNGGGGGAGSAGGNAGANTPGNGGSGTNAFSSWATATGTGVSGYYAGGGGGTGYPTTSAGTGGSGGGGAGNGSGAGSSGTANTGGGGGGSGSGGHAGGAGGSGIVIVRYLKTAVKASTSAYELIGTVLLSANTSQVVFTGLPASQYTHLQLRVSARSTAANTAEDVYLRFNSDATSSNYYYHGVYSTGSAVGAENNGSLAGARVMQCVGANGTSGSYGVGFVDILDFASTTKTKTLRSLNGHADGTPRLWQSSNMWNSQAAITSITIVTSSGASYAAGSRFSLYGLRGS